MALRRVTLKPWILVHNCACQPMPPPRPPGPAGAARPRRVHVMQFIPELVTNYAHIIMAGLLVCAWLPRCDDVRTDVHASRLIRRHAALAIS